MVEKFFLVYLQLVDVVQSSLHWKKNYWAIRCKNRCGTEAIIFQNRENFWKEFLSRATENNQFWFTNNPTALAALPRRNVRTASLKTLGADPGWRFYCRSCCPELCPRAASRSLNVKTLTSVQKEVPPVKPSLDETLLMSSSSACQRGPPPPTPTPWPLTDEMKEPHPAWNKKGLHQHRVSPSVCFFPCTPWSIHPKKLH